VRISTNSAELTAKALKYLKTDAQIQEKFKGFLALQKTGIVTLLPEKACVELDSREKIKFDKLIERCPFAFVPGGAEFYSFRRHEFVNYPLADIGFKDNKVFSLGSLNQGILVDLGDAALEGISLDTKGVDFLTNYAPAATLEKAAEDAKKFEDGFKSGDFLYKNVLPFEKDRTYALRVVAYQPYFLKKDSVLKEIKSYPMGEDERVDITVAFRVVEKTADGSVVLIWKELKNSLSPELLVPNAAPEK
jgi:hypothetical protein